LEAVPGALDQPGTFDRPQTALMPEGILVPLSDQELRDLVAYLRSEPVKAAKPAAR
jgi:hypothetical protein